MDYSRYHSLSCERQDAVLIVSLNRPEALNAINAALHTELSHIFADIAQDQETHVVVLTGKGRAFSAGGDIKWFQDLTPPQLEALFTEARKIIVDLLEVQQPMIAAVNGPTTGLGATLALFSDVIFAADNARIGDPVWSKYSNSPSDRRSRLSHCLCFGLSSTPLSPILSVHRDGNG